MWNICHGIQLRTYVENFGMYLDTWNIVGMVYKLDEDAIGI
jgi:hypothetical protein